MPAAKGFRTWVRCPPPPPHQVALDAPESDPGREGDRLSASAFKRETARSDRTACHAASDALARRLLRVALQERVVLLLGLVPRIPVVPLQEADHLVGLALGALEIVVRQLAPLLLRLPLHLLPATSNDVRVHVDLLAWNTGAEFSCARAHGYAIGVPV